MSHLIFTPYILHLFNLAMLYYVVQYLFPQPYLPGRSAASKHGPLI